MDRRLKKLLEKGTKICRFLLCVQRWLSYCFFSMPQNFFQCIFNVFCFYSFNVAQQQRKQSCQHWQRVDFEVGLTQNTCCLNSSDDRILFFLRRLTWGSNYLSMSYFYFPISAYWTGVSHLNKITLALVGNRYYLTKIHNRMDDVCFAFFSKTELLLSVDIVLLPLIIINK